MNRRSAFILFSGAFLVGLAFAWAFYAPRSLAAGQLQPVMQSKGDNQICALSDERQQHTQETFAAFEQLLRSDPPRCINCHGRMSPFIEGTKHPGGRLRIVHDSNGRRDFAATRQGQCLLCHIAPWQAPLLNDLWHFQNSVQLCTHFRTDSCTKDAECLQKHLRSDPFADLAYKGERGLDDTGQIVYEGEFGHPPQPEPPSFTRADLTLYASLWTDSYDGKYNEGGPTCGCKPHQYAFQINVEEGVRPPNAQGEIKGQANFKVPIKFQDKGLFQGEAAVDHEVSGTVAYDDITCTTTIKIVGETWKFSGKLDEVNNMQIVVNIEGGTQNSHSVCTTSDGQVIPVEVTIPPGKFSFPFDMPAIVGETKLGLNWSNPQGGFDNAKITIVEETAP